MVKSACQTIEGIVDADELCGLQLLNVSGGGAMIPVILDAFQQHDSNQEVSGGGDIEIGGVTVLEIMRLEMRI